MKIIKVLGSGCAKCTKTAEVVSEIAKALNIEVDISKETDPEVIMSYGVMRTPAVVVDENLVHSGSIPNRQDIEKWLS
ncbi:thioredoxin family protein [Psychromonas algicola]|uniref:thioredoxin family protein n=1 Tax=Psychromonas algicola TaxID=2555642 RepID=UPI0010672490|nr:thioredoxin family protein [Psychromonas sp. RZ5]TEW51524.1 thioredoxin family protein [Psychromonas sp. RZ5]